MTIPKSKKFKITLFELVHELAKQAKLKRGQPYELTFEFCVHADDFVTHTPLECLPIDDTDTGRICYDKNTLH